MGEASELNKQSINNKGQQFRKSVKAFLYNQNLGEAIEDCNKNESSKKSC